MTNRLPKISDKHKICIICEGNEEYKYLERLDQLHVWNDIYEISLVNAEGNGNIPARYQDRYQNGSYEAVLVFCDTEKKPYEQYEDIKRKINEFHGIDNAADEVIKKPAKVVNAPLIEKFTGVKGYKGRNDQIERVMESITADNYKDMCNRVQCMEQNDHVDGSSNFAKLLEKLGTDNIQWIDEINDKMGD